MASRQGQGFPRITGKVGLMNHQQLPSKSSVTRRQYVWIAHREIDLYDLAYGRSCIDSSDIGKLVRFAYAVATGTITRDMLEEAARHAGLQSDGNDNYLRLFLDDGFDGICKTFASIGEYLGDDIEDIEDIPSE